MPINSSIQINSSVGLHGRNIQSDVKTIQTRLNELMGPSRSHLKVDGKAGRNTRNMIYDFQKNVVGLRSPDSRVDPVGKTIRALNDPSSESKWRRMSVPSQVLNEAAFKEIKKIAVTDSEHYTKYNTIHKHSATLRIIKALPDDDKLTPHPSIRSELPRLKKILADLRKKNPNTYFGEIYSKVLLPGPMRQNYQSAALHTACTQVDNRTRYYLQLTLVRYIIAHGRNFSQIKRGEFSYAIHEYAFRKAGGVGTIGIVPWMLLETVDVTRFNISENLPIGDFLIIMSIKYLNPPSGRFGDVQLLIRQYIDYVSELWRPIL